jgi:general secretion pathway protein C
MFARLSAFVIWSLVAATAVFWVLRFAASPPRVPAYAVAVGNSVAVRGDLGRLFGVAPRAIGLAQAAPEAPSRFKLIGVMAPRGAEAQSAPGNGVALIAVDGKPAKPFAVGAPLDGNLVLQSVGMRTASLGPAQGARSVLLELPALPPPNSGVLAPIGAGGAVPPSTGVRSAPAGLPAGVPAIGTVPPAAAAQPPLPNQPAPSGMPNPGSLATQ